MQSPFTCSEGAELLYTMASLCKGSLSYIGSSVYVMEIVESPHTGAFVSLEIGNGQKESWASSGLFLSCWLSPTWVDRTCAVSF